MRRLSLLLLVVVTSLSLARPATAVAPLEDYAPYQPATRCAPAAKPGTVLFARWTVNRYGGRLGGISRACGGARSEHQEGRAFDWSVDVRRAADRARVARLMRDLFAANAAGEPDALARRMGIMYLIWDDRIWSAWDGFEPRPYRSSSCPSLRRCSRTLRHLDHVHVSFTRSAAAGHTSWFVGRL